jgi:hypothetical protein
MKADLETHERWVMKTIFAVYAWNASPIGRARTSYDPLRPRREHSDSNWKCKKKNNINQDSPNGRGSSVSACQNDVPIMVLTKEAFEIVK